MKVWFWQLIISPHMVNLASELAEIGVDVSYIANQEMSEDRRKQGWLTPPLGKADLKLVPTKNEAVALANSAPNDVLHICQGIRGNGVISAVQSALKKSDRKQIVVMETVDDHGFFGYFKRLIYFCLFKVADKNLLAVLATGLNTADWVVARGVNQNKVFPFAYFLPEAESSHNYPKAPSSRFRFIFVGQFIQLKRLDLLIEALASLPENRDFELAVVGSGALETELKEKAEAMLPDRVDWIGSLPMAHVREEMRTADCLVLPSRYDGWGAVVSEALMSGTPVIVSNACGSAVVVKASGVGGVFRSGILEELILLLHKSLLAGKIDPKQRLCISKWASCLSGKSGASYLLQVLDSLYCDSSTVLPPWHSELS
ncbi:glycosyltransferase family 4 protein [Halomonas korlensis]|uniref:Glycosyltransferase involved in cell wall bisynthesis n=1 Tax=Halomonas korlensis TaxID=463301 RepID=A0A1I7KDI9_9GAMM|nr:glycosyltransferase family 4 protein [Halomonas korlensis]SFU95551.1 Glycosyltransferase involved in cell wall bisynthesis [Halomonas korlensis]